MKENSLRQNKNVSFWTSPRVLFCGFAVALFVAGCYFRLVGLDSTSSHGDAQFYDWSRAGVTPWDMLTRWPEIIGGPMIGQMPAPAAFTRLVMDVFHLPTTRFNVILPSALWGIAAIPVALWVGWRFRGGAFALLLMGVVALNPMHVQMSRMAYYYPPAVLGSLIAVWCLLESLDSVRERWELRWTFHVAHAGATVLLFYSTYGAWPFAFSVALFHVGCAIFNRFKRGAGWRDLVAIGLTYMVAGVPLLFVSWGLNGMLSNTGDNESARYYRKIFEVSRQAPLYLQIGPEFLKLAWGWTPGRMAFSGLVVISGIVTTAILARWKKAWLLPPCLFLVSIVPIVLALRAGVWPFGLRRAAVSWPSCLILIALGLYGFWLAGDRLCRSRVLRWCGLIPIAAAFGLWVQADMLVVKVNGFVVPYRMISNWLDRTFPKGTPVVTDRFFTAMCEFNNSDPPSNVVVISTAPNELPEIQEKTHFRQLTRQYFEENPDAVFYCAGHMYDRPEVVPWQWPEEYFRRRQELRDAVQGQLCLVGQSYWGEYPGTVRWPVIFYNTVDDMIDINKKAGKAAFVTYGPEWRPVQTQDYRLWRLMTSDTVTVKVYRINPDSSDVVADIEAVSVGVPSRLRIGQADLEFPPNQIIQQKIRLSLNMGENLVAIKRSGGKAGGMLIKKIAFSPGLDSVPR
ncbi:MAG: hypothetical protein WCS01_06180 [bacterium]